MALFLELQRSERKKFHVIIVSTSLTVTVDILKKNVMPNPNLSHDSAATRFLVPSNATPLSDVTDDSVSSYDDGPAENGANRTFPVIEQRLYVINRAGTGEASYLLLTEEGDDILSYRVHTERWRATENLMHFGVVVLGQHIYVIGGFHKGRAVYLNKVMRYDVCEGDWSECRHMIHARAKFGVCALNGKIYVCGGERTDGKVTASCEVYDPDTNSWSKCGMLLAPRANCACVGYGDELLCAGGYQGGTAHNNLWIYERRQWQEMDEDYPHCLPYNLDKCAIATVDNTFYFIGGTSTLPYATPKPRPTKSSMVQRQAEEDEFFHRHHYLQLEHHLQHHKKEEEHNSHLLTVPDKRRKMKSEGSKRAKFQTERRMFAYTTQIKAKDRNSIISPWNIKLPPMIHARHSAGAVAIGRKIHVVGGRSVETGQVLKVSEHFDLDRGIWEEDFTLRKCDVSNVCCVHVEVPKVPFHERRNTYRLRWVMW